MYIRFYFLEHISLDLDFIKCILLNIYRIDKNEKNTIFSEVYYTCIFFFFAITCFILRFTFVVAAIYVHIHIYKIAQIQDALFSIF